MKNKYFRLFYSLAFLLAFVSFTKAQCDINSFTLTPIAGTCAQDTQVNVVVPGGISCGNATATIRLQGTTTDITFRTLTAGGLATFDNLKPGAYEVRLQQGATTTAYKKVTTTSSYKPIVVTATSENTSCANTDPLFTNNGKVTVSFSGGNGPFTVTLTGPGGPYTFATATTASHTFSNLAPGSYTATVQDNSITCTSAEARSVTITETPRVALNTYTRRRTINSSCQRILELVMDSGNVAYTRQTGSATYQIAGDPTVYQALIIPSSTQRTTFYTQALPANVDVTFTVTDGCRTITEVMNSKDVEKPFTYTHNVSTGPDCKPIYTINMTLWTLDGPNKVGIWSLSPNSKVVIYREVPADSGNWVKEDEISKDFFWLTRNSAPWTTGDFNTRFKYVAVDANGCNTYENIVDARTAKNVDPLASAKIDAVPSILDGTVAFTITKNGAGWPQADQLGFPITIAIERTDGQQVMNINPSNPYSIAKPYTVNFPYSVTVSPPDWTFNQPTFSDLPPDGVINIDYTYQTILSQSCQKDVSWLIWTFNHDWNAERKISPTSNVNNLTAFGQDVLYNPTYGLKTTNCNSSTLGTVELQNAKTVNIFPNPAKDYFSVEAKDIVSVEVYGFDGKLLKTFTKDFKHLAISDLQSGVYPILIKTNGKAYGEKLIVRK